MSLYRYVWHSDSDATVYAIIRSTLTGLLWDNTTEAFAAYAEEYPWSDYAVPLAVQGDSGTFIFTMPAEIPAGEYDIEFRVVMPPEEPGESDEVIDAGLVQWAGSAYHVAVDVTGSVTGDVGGRVLGGGEGVIAGVGAQVDCVSISGDADAADALEAMLDGTGGVTLSLSQLHIVGSHPGEGSLVVENEYVGAPAITVIASGGSAVYLDGKNGLEAYGTDYGFMLAGSKVALYLGGVNAGLEAYGQNGGPGIYAYSYGGAGGPGMKLSGSAGDLLLAGSQSVVGNINGNVSGNVSGNVGGRVLGGGNTEFVGLGAYCNVEAVDNNQDAADALRWFVNERAGLLDASIASRLAAADYEPPDNAGIAAAAADAASAKTAAQAVQAKLPAGGAAIHAAGAAVAKSPATLDWAADVANKPTIGTSTLSTTDLDARGVTTANKAQTGDSYPVVTQFSFDGGRVEAISTLETQAIGATKFHSSGLEAIAAAVEALVAGDGARLVQITVTDGVTPLQGARVRVVSGIENYVQRTDSEGLVVFHLDDGPWSVRITKPGYQSETIELVVEDDVEEEYPLTAAAPAAPPPIEPESYAIPVVPQPNEAGSYARY